MFFYTKIQIKIYINCMGSGSWCTCSTADAIRERLQRKPCSPRRRMPGRAKRWSGKRGPGPAALSGQGRGAAGINTDR
ncbi:MAG: hypothetical protein U5P10_12260 [Spirochaetia bacterium]|nr:hypothetical protein [Spirochaetia bacterium]